MYLLSYDKSFNVVFFNQKNYAILEITRHEVQYQHIAFIFMVQGLTIIQHTSAPEKVISYIYKRVSSL